MLKSSGFAATFIFAVLFSATTSDAQVVPVNGASSILAEKNGEASPDNGQTPTTIVGSWRVRTITIAKDGNEQVTKSQAEEPTNMIIAEKNITLRIGKRVISEMQYELDQKQTPWHFNLKSPDGSSNERDLQTGKKQS